MFRLNKRHHRTVILLLQVKRKYFFYMMNLVIPCALIACMIFLVFLLPPKSGERISLGITVLLSMAIFQELSSEKLPSSSDTFPLLGMFPSHLQEFSLFSLVIPVYTTYPFLRCHYIVSSTIRENYFSFYSPDLTIKSILSYALLLMIPGKPSL